MSMVKINGKQYGLDEVEISFLGKKVDGIKAVEFNINNPVDFKLTPLKPKRIKNEKALDKAAKERQELINKIWKAQQK